MKAFAEAWSLPGQTKRKPLINLLSDFGLAITSSIIAMPNAGAPAKGSRVLYWTCAGLRKRLYGISLV